MMRLAGLYTNEAIEEVKRFFNTNIRFDIKT